MLDEKCTILFLMGILLMFLGMSGGGFKNMRLIARKVYSDSQATLITDDLNTHYVAQPNRLSPELVRALFASTPSIRRKSPQVKTQDFDQVDQLEQLLEAWEVKEIKNNFLFTAFSRFDLTASNTALPFEQKVNIQGHLEILGLSIEEVARIKSVLTHPLLIAQEKIEALNTFEKEVLPDIRLSANDSDEIKELKERVFASIDYTNYIYTAQMKNS